jgi:hypothetical protein
MSFSKHCSPLTKLTNVSDSGLIQQLCFIQQPNKKLAFMSTQPPPMKPTKTNQPAGKQNGQLLKEPQPRPSSHVASSTNDGTHRLTVRWTVPKEINIEELINNRAQMESTILTLIQPLFEDSDGHFYRWESDNLTQERDVIST